MEKIDVEINWSTDAAAEVLDQVDRIKSAFNELTQIVSRDLAKDEQVAVRRFLGALMGAMLSELSMPIEDRYPALRRAHSGES